LGQVCWGSRRVLSRHTEELAILVVVEWTKDDGPTVWLVRHGESTWNALGLVQGHADGPTLTEEGLRQSAQAAEHFRARNVAAVYASDLERAQQTAACIAPVVGCSIQTVAALRERCFGSREGQPLTSLQVEESGISGGSVVDASARPEGGESLDQVYDRVGAFMEWLTDQSHTGDVILVTHGGTIRAIRAYCAGVPMVETAWEAVPNGSVWSIHHATATQASQC
jgi:2,3-bisphosphoglycerate-dependent phosphoglycerate mutase